MPKMKTKKSAAKRFKLTGSGKIRRRKAFTSHIMSSKSQKQKRKLRKGAILDPNNEKGVRRMLGLA